MSAPIATSVHNEPYAAAVSTTNRARRFTGLTAVSGQNVALIATIVIALTQSRHDAYAACCTLRPCP